jgi:hypothetical protein
MRGSEDVCGWACVMLLLLAKRWPKPQQPTPLLPVLLQRQPNHQRGNLPGCSHEVAALPANTHTARAQLRGRTSRGSARMIVSVVMSSATRVPLVSLTLSTLVRQPTT